MVELLLLCPQDEAESVSDALMDELGALSVSVEDADADTEAERALFGEPGMPVARSGWDRSIVKALFDDGDAAQEAAGLLLAQAGTGWCFAANAVSFVAVILALRTIALVPAWAPATGGASPAAAEERARMLASAARAQPLPSPCSLDRPPPLLAPAGALSAALP